MKQDYSTYYMRCWLRLLWHSWSYHHTLLLSLYYILEALIITIPHFQLFMFPWIYINTSNSPVIYITTIFLLGPMMTCSQLLIAIKNSSCGGPPWNILIGYLFLDVSVLYLLSTSFMAISFQNSGSCSPLDQSDW